MNFLLFLLTVFLLSISSIASSDNSSAQSSSMSQGGNGFGGDGGMGGSSSSISQGGNGFGGQGGMGGLGGHGGTAYGGIGGAGGIGTGTGGNAANAGNSQSFHFDQVRQSPAVFMGAPMPTAPCQASIGGFLSFIGGIGLAGSRTLEECEKRETSRISHAIGQHQMALEIMCMTEYGAKTSVCNNLTISGIGNEK